jgi:nucleotide-binding universal stress UspA family protein
MKPIDKILFACDFSENSNQALDHALMFARQFNARLVILHVINEPVDLRGFYVPHISFDRLEKEIEEGAQQMMQKFAKDALSGFENYETCIITGIPYEEIIRKAAEEQVGMIVLGTHGRTGVDHFLFGSTAERVVRTAPCPVLTVRAT